LVCWTLAFIWGAAVAFVEHYVNEDGFVPSDGPTVYALAVRFELLDETHTALAGNRLAELTKKGGYKVVPVPRDDTAMNHFQAGVRPVTPATGP
jgi:hypothetical protein